MVTERDKKLDMNGNRFKIIVFIGFLSSSFNIRLNKKSGVITDEAIIFDLFEDAPAMLGSLVSDSIVGSLNFCS